MDINSSRLIWEDVWIEWLNWIKVFEVHRIKAINIPKWNSIISHQHFLNSLSLSLHRMGSPNREINSQARWTYVDHLYPSRMHSPAVLYDTRSSSLHPHRGWHHEGCACFGLGLCFFCFWFAGFLSSHHRALVRGWTGVVVKLSFGARRDWSLILFDERFFDLKS